ncbi:MAG: hypothetical protein AB7O24_29080 [Kofleriaceae bacterium]
MSAVTCAQIRVETARADAFLAAQRHRFALERHHANGTWWHGATVRDQAISDLILIRQTAVAEHQRVLEMSRELPRELEPAALDLAAKHREIRLFVVEELRFWTTDPDNSDEMSVSI